MQEAKDPVWSGPRFKAIDDSVATLVSQLLKAVAAMVVAFAAARGVSAALGLGDGAGELVAEGALFVVFGLAAIYLTSARPIRAAISAQRAAIAEHERQLQFESDRHAFSANLQSAFEMIDDEEGAYGVVRRALTAVVDSPAELLLADSSRAHLRRVVVSPAAEAPACGVATPWACPAVRRGQTLEFASSGALAACPHLADRTTGACSAVCVPVTVLGTPAGVLHVTGVDGAVRDADEVASLEGLAQQSGSRIGVLRAMARSEQQAGTDPLTGQVNRRSLVTSVRDLREAGHGYAVAMIDVDHFKVLNDTYGHDLGDRALRVVAQALSESVRDVDVVCRYGGDEFVVVFPRCTVVEAAAVVHRARDDLARRTSTGEVPAFTASYGLADSTDASTFDAVLHLADAALLRAKIDGRDRLVIADEHDVAEFVEPER